MDVLVGDGNRFSGASASTSRGVPFMGNVSSPSKQARMGGLVADGEEAQHHRVPFRHESFVPSASAGIPFVRISAPNSVEKASSTSMGGRIDGLVADGEEVQHHRVPLRQASSIPSDNTGKQVLADTFVGFNHGQQYEGDFIHGDISDPELSQKELFDDIKDLVEKSVERIVKRRTNLRKKKKFIADNTKPDSEAIIIGEKSIPIDPKSFELVLGIPAGQLPVETDEEAGKLGFLSLFGLSEVPTVRCVSGAAGGSQVRSGGGEAGPRRGRSERSGEYGADVREPLTCARAQKPASSAVAGAARARMRSRLREWAEPEASRGGAAACFYLGRALMRCTCVGQMSTETGAWATSIEVDAHEPADGVEARA
ncbi:hypothetical protein QYE76_047544 [Lolium multiflorum]|uniref:Uncharacterized protein n=1 Tax=Lolium multiflorum TaxID=4521 RepID=A0AAD8TS51_LOLMU|nr:hypothetical protein QYE76_047544 [Lolium multiflorum]